MPNDSIDSPAFHPEAVGWRKSSFSAYGECVAVAEWDSQIAMRNSNNPGAGTLFFSRAEMSAWIEGLKAGEFDDLTT